MPSPPPPTQQQADQAQRARFAAELAILALFRSSDEGGGDGESEFSMLHTVAVAAIITALAVAIISSSFGDPRDRNESLPQEGQSQKQIGDDLVPELQRVFQKLMDSELSDEQRAVLWATWAYSRTADHIAELVNTSGAPAEFAGKKLKKVWISRADNRVRPLHLRLHGKTVTSSEDFWRWPDTGQRLRWPGDPDAPLDATIGCRCVCVLTWASQDAVSETIRKIVEQTTPD